jgi:hypothetical protein
MAVQMRLATSRSLIPPVRFLLILSHRLLIRPGITTPSQDGGQLAFNRPPFGLGLGHAIAPFRIGNISAAEGRGEPPTPFEDSACATRPVLHEPASPSYLIVA